MRAKITAAVVSSITVKQTLITKKIEAWFSFRFLYMVANKKDYLLWKFRRIRTIFVTFTNILN